MQMNVRCQTKKWEQLPRQSAPTLFDDVAVPIREIMPRTRYFATSETFLAE